jgi:glycosyltransferase involved in cell wall biosynthesis
MRVGVDGRSLAGDRDRGLRQPRGVSRYTSSLLGALASRHPEDDWLALGPRGGAPPDGVSARRSLLAGRAGHAAAAVAGRPRLDRLLGGGLDVLWLPAPAPVAVSAQTPYVLTLHDLSFEAMPEALTAYERLWSRVARPRDLARRAARVMTVSRATREEAIARYGLRAEQVVVVPPGVWRPPPAAPAEVEQVRRRLSLPERYLLFVGALEPRKGLEVLTRAYRDARARGLPLPLVLVGDGPLRGRLRGGDMVLAGRVSDRELGALYAGARATVLPSVLEGFGFTPLESLAAGTPVIVSDLPALRETLGDGALRVPPGDATALTDALLAVDADTDLRRELLAAGRPAPERFSWERAAEEAYAVLGDAAGGQRP